VLTGREIGPGGRLSCATGSPDRRGSEAQSTSWTTITRTPRHVQLERYREQRLSTSLGADEDANEQALGAGFNTDDAIDLARTLTNPESQPAVAGS
jgi:hypothetical protein